MSTTRVRCSAIRLSRNQLKATERLEAMGIQLQHESEGCIVVSITPDKQQEVRSQRVVSMTTTGPQPPSAIVYWWVYGSTMYAFMIRDPRTDDEVATGQPRLRTFKQITRPAQQLKQWHAKQLVAVLQPFFPRTNRHVRRR